MKQCPKCQSTYTDETLKYCLTDGTILARPKDPPETLRMPSPDVTELQRKPDTLSERRSPDTDRKKSRAISAGLLSLLFVFGVGILAIFAWTKIRSGQGSKSTASSPTTSSQGQATDPANPERESLYADDFSAASLKDNWQVVSGDWYTKDGVLEGVSNRKDSFGAPVWAAVTLNRDLPADCSVSFRTRIIDGELSELMLHLSNNRYVRVYLYTINETVVLGDGKFLRENNPGSAGLAENQKQVGGGGSVASREFPVMKGTWYNVRVTAKGNTYTISVGGQMVVKYIDATNLLNKEGTIGLISNGHMQYDDLKILNAER